MLEYERSRRDVVLECQFGGVDVLDDDEFVVDEELEGSFSCGADKWEELATGGPGEPQEDVLWVVGPPEEDEVCCNTSPYTINLSSPSTLTTLARTYRRNPGRRSHEFDLFSVRTFRTLCANTNRDPTHPPSVRPSTPSNRSVQQLLCSRMRDVARNTHPIRHPTVWNRWIELDDRVPPS